MNRGITCAIAAFGLLAVASFAFAGPGGAGRAGGMPAGAMGGGMRSSMTPNMTPNIAMSSGHASRDAHHSMDPSVAAHADPASLLGQNSKLDSRLQKLLPAGTTPQQACAGFSQLGSCVAALHVATNLGIPFTDLKARLTGSEAVSLGSAIKELKPQVNAGHAERKAQGQARRDLQAVDEQESTP
jgi:hypothetical protein